MCVYLVKQAPSYSFKPLTHNCTVCTAPACACHCLYPPPPRVDRARGSSLLLDCPTQVHVQQPPMSTALKHTLSSKHPRTHPKAHSAHVMLHCRVPGNLLPHTPPSISLAAPPHPTPRAISITRQPTTPHNARRPSCTCCPSSPAPVQSPPAAAACQVLQRRPAAPAH
jgi:hypothetical protein